MDGATRVSPEVEAFLRAVRDREVGHAADLLKTKPELLNGEEAGGYSALHFAAFNGDIPMLRMLLEHKPKVDIENYDGNTPLVMAVKGRQLDAIRTLVEAGADPNAATSSGSTATHHAVSMGYLDCAELLIELGAKIIYETSVAGSLLHWACHSGDVSVVGAMIYKYHIPVDVTDQHGGTPLLTALFMKKVEVVEFLLEHGANPNVTVAEDGTTALHIAVEHATGECVVLLRAFGADASTANKEGETPLQIAERLKNGMLVKELKKSQTPKEKRKTEAERLKEQGNKAFSEGECVKASRFYTLCIRLDNTNHVFFSNRAACYFSRQFYTGAYWDAMRCVTLAPQWPRGYVRKCATELALKKYDDAINTASEGLKLDPSNKDLLSFKSDATLKRR